MHSAATDVEAGWVARGPPSQAKSHAVLAADMHGEASPPRTEPKAAELTDSLRTSRAQLERDYNANWQPKIASPPRTARRVQQRSTTGSAVASTASTVHTGVEPVRGSTRRAQRRPHSRVKGAVSTFLDNLEMDVPSSCAPHPRVCAVVVLTALATQWSRHNTPLLRDTHTAAELGVSQ